MSKFKTPPTTSTTNQPVEQTKIDPPIPEPDQIPTAETDSLGLNEIQPRPGPM